MSCARQIQKGFSYWNGKNERPEKMNLRGKEHSAAVSYWPGLSKKKVAQRSG